MRFYIKICCLLSLCTTPTIVSADGKTKKDISLDEKIKAVEKAGKSKADAEKVLSTYLNAEELKIKNIREQLGFAKSGFAYRVFTPSVRTFFDTGTDDPGEIDLYKNGTLGLSLNFISLDYMWGFKKANIGPTFSLGLASASGEGTDESVVFFWGAGLRTTLKGSTNIPVNFEIGYMQGISADEKLNSTQRDDGAIYVSIDIPIVNK